MENNEFNYIFRKIVNYLFIITIFFGLGYWCGKNNYNYSTTIKYLSSNKESSEKTVKTKSKEETPERYTFSKSLKDDDELLLPVEKLKVEKKVVPREKKVLKPVTLQLASFKKKKFAINYIKKLNKAGLEPYIKKYDLKKQGIWYRVLWGEFESKKAALEYAKQNLKPLNIYYLAVRK